MALGRRILKGLGAGMRTFGETYWQIMQMLERQEREKLQRERQEKWAREGRDIGIFTGTTLPLLEPGRSAKVPEVLRGKVGGEPTERLTRRVPHEVILSGGRRMPIGKTPVTATVPRPGEEYYQKPLGKTFEQDLAEKARILQVQEAIKSQFKEPPKEPTELDEVRLEKEKIQTRIAKINEDIKKKKRDEPKKDLTGERRKKLMPEARRLVQLDKWNMMLQEPEKYSTQVERYGADYTKLPVTTNELNAKINELMTVTYGADKTGFARKSYAEEQALRDKFDRVGSAGLTEDERAYIRWIQGKTGKK